MTLILAAAMMLNSVVAFDDGADVESAPAVPSESLQDAPEVASPVEVVYPATTVRAVWLRLAECESSGRWHIYSPPYYGGLQEDMTFWRRHGGLQYASRPDLATMEQQVAVAEVGLKVQGWIAWPACSRRLGLR